MDEYKVEEDKVDKYKVDKYKVKEDNVENFQIFGKISDFQKNFMERKPVGWLC